MFIEFTLFSSLSFNAYKMQERLKQMFIFFIWDQIAEEILFINLSAYLYYRTVVCFAFMSKFSSYFSPLTVGH